MRLIVGLRRAGWDAQVRRNPPLRRGDGEDSPLAGHTLELVIGSGLEFEERGVHELKGVPGEWHLFAVASP